MAFYRSADGDMVDLICFDYYGTHDGGVVEAVYAHNRDLATYPAKLPAGVLIELLDRPPATPVATRRLWD